MKRVLGLDVGGANLKAALDDGTARSLPFALWREPLRLSERLATLTDGWEFDAIALTMTAELCDCFATRSEGVRVIVAAVESAFSNKPIQVWTLDGQFVTPATANEQPLKAAAANWLALATWAGRLAPHGPAVLIDVGSTTTDIVSLMAGRPTPRGFTDAERISCGELVYTGVRRTPVCALAGFDVMAELFASTLDIYLLLGRIPVDANDRDTADGRPADVDHARGRLARILGQDPESADASAIDSLARQVYESQRNHIVKQARRVFEPNAPTTIITAGSGEFLAIEVAIRLEGRRVSLNETLGEATSTAACAHAVAVLVRDWL